MTPVVITAGDLSVSILTWGALIQDVRLAGVDYSLTCNAPTLTDYQGAYIHHGSLIGPLVNRISTARVKVAGMMHELERNQDGRIHLHSGKHGTHRQDWTLMEQKDASVTLQIILPDGMCGLPGHRVITVTYAVTPPATLTMTVEGVSDEPTLMNFANHSYWNLDGATDWSGHKLQVAADRYLPINDDTCPTGEIADLTGTPMDFRSLRPVTVGTDHFDNNFCLSDAVMPLRDILTLQGTSGVGMTMATNQTGVQIFDGRGLPKPYEGLAIEAQGWPDAPNHRGFPTVKLAAGDIYENVTQWRFTR